MPKRDIDVIAIYRRTGIGKTTLAVSLALTYRLSFPKSIIVSNVGFKGVENTVQMSRVDKMLEYVRDHPDDGCIVVLDELDKSFTSNLSWLTPARLQKLTDLMSNARKYGAVAMIATSQGRKKVNNLYRQNCKYVMEPTGTLDSAKCPEFLLWDDPELYEQGRARYSEDVLLLCESLFPLPFLDSVFDTREVVPLEWEDPSVAQAPPSR